MSTMLQKTPFAFLGVTTRDDRRRIVELAEEKSLELDHEACQKARSDLTSPRNRLSAEVAWLPGISPRKASLLVEDLMQNPMAIRLESGLPILAHLNLLAAAFEVVTGEHDVEDLSNFILEVAYLVENLKPEDVLRDINEDRAVSGFPEIKSLEQIEFELIERKRYYRNVIKATINKLPPKTLISIMTEVVDVVTSGGMKHAPELIDELVDSYEVETQSFLEKEAENVLMLITTARDLANGGEDEAVLKAYIDKLEVVSRNWDAVAQPIQVSAMARGTAHDASRSLAYEIRSLAIDLCNDHDMLGLAQQLTDLIQELFSEISDVAERVKQDSDALVDLVQDRAQEERLKETRRNEFVREITYSAEVGMIFKEKLSISPDGISWRGKLVPLDSITRVRWGGVRNSVNGIPTGTNYTIGFGDKHSEVIIELKKQTTYSSFIEKLWRAVCIRLLGELLESLKAGEVIAFGNAFIHDDGITLIKHKFWSSDEKVHCQWHQVQIWDADGSFLIGSKEDKKAYVSISYINVANTHILEQAIRMAFKKPGMRRLSDLLM